MLCVEGAELAGLTVLHLLDEDFELIATITGSRWNDLACIARVVNQRWSPGCGSRVTWATLGTVLGPPGRSSEAGNLTDVLVRDVPDDVVVALEARAARLGLSPSEFHPASGAALTSTPVAFTRWPSSTRPARSSAMNWRRSSMAWWIFGLRIS